MTCINPAHNGKVAMWCSECYDAMKLQISELTKCCGCKKQIPVQGQYMRCQGCAGAFVKSVIDVALAEKMQESNRLIDELREMVDLAVDAGGFSFHEEGCPEDDTCDCPDVKRVNAAMGDFKSKRSKTSINLPTTEKQIEPVKIEDHPFGCMCQDNVPGICHVVRITGKHCDQPLPCPSHG